MCSALAPEMPPIPERPDHIDGDMWHAAHARYRIAAATYSRFQATRYRPAVAAMDAEGESADPVLRAVLFDKYGLRALEELGNDLLVDQIEQVRALVATPAPDWDAVVLKIEILFHDIYVDEPDHLELIAELLADARRLSRRNAG